MDDGVERLETGEGGAPTGAIARIMSELREGLERAPDTNLQRIRFDAYTFRDSLEHGRVSFSIIDQTKLDDLIDTAMRAADRLYKAGKVATANTTVSLISALARHNHTVAKDLDRTGRLDDGRSTANIAFGKIDLTTLRGGGSLLNGAYDDVGPG